jgi:hypothetical protein
MHHVTSLFMMASVTSHSLCLPVPVQVIFVVLVTTSIQQTGEREREREKERETDSVRRCIRWTCGQNSLPRSFVKDLIAKTFHFPPETSCIIYESYHSGLITLKRYLLCYDAVWQKFINVSVESAASIFRVKE